MVRQNNSRPGRVTPSKSTAADTVTGSSGISRNPVRVGGGVLQAAVPVLMFVMMGLGLVVILLNYVITSFGAPSNWYLLGGLGLILAGIVMATQYR